MELIYPFVRDRQLCASAEFAKLHPRAVIVFKRVSGGDQGDTQLVPQLEGDLAPVARALRHEAHQYRLVKLEPGKTVSVGRAPENTIVLADDSVSRKHAELQVRADGSVEAIDLGSDNGSLVIGSEGPQRLPRVLKDGDRLRFGSVLVFYFRPVQFFDFLATLLDPRAAPGA